MAKNDIGNNNQMNQADKSLRNHRTLRGALNNNQSYNTASGLKSNAGYSNNYMEYLVPKKNTAGTTMAKIGIIAALAIVFFITSAIIAKYVPYIIAVYLTLYIVLGWYLLRFFSVEYEYVIAAGEMEMEVIYGRRQRKKLANFKLKDVEFCAPYEEAYKNRISNPEIKKVVNACSSMSAKNLYFIIYKNEKGEKELMYFDALKKTVSILKFYTGSSTVDSDKLEF
ncbi:MAG: hypothetical protein E7665_06090 [Ruminococcaceae bacterium]|nr:hypothetical protein [Oscillospiraceae bacterium]